MHGHQFKIAKLTVICNIDRATSIWSHPAPAQHVRHALMQQRQCYARVMSVGYIVGVAFSVKDVMLSCTYFAQI